MPVFRMEKKGNFTVMSNYHLRDKRISLKAKGLLSQLLSLPETWKYSLAGLASINPEQKSAIRSAVRELEQAGYLERRQTTDTHGKFSDSEYIIYEHPREQPTEPLPSSSPPPASAAEPLLAEPSPESPAAGYTETENPTAGNPAQLNIDIQNREKENTYGSSTEDNFFPSSGRDGAAVRDAIREQIEYNALVTYGNRAQLDELVELMVEVNMNRSPFIRLGRDTEYDTAYVQDRFRRITSEHIEKVLEGIRENTSRVRNTRAYLLSALFHSVSTLDNHYAMLVNHDRSMA